jgi:hypothetical protein
MIFSFEVLVPAVAGTAVAASGSAASFFRNDRRIIGLDLTIKRLHPAMHFDDLSAFGFDGSVAFARHVFPDDSRRCRDKTTRRVLADC